MRRKEEEEGRGDEKKKKEMGACAWVDGKRREETTFSRSKGKRATDRHKRECDSIACSL